MTASTPTDPGDWRAHAHRLAEELTAAGKLTTTAWHTAICATPRHHFIPTYFQQNRDSWEEISTDTPEALPTVYSNTVLLTALTDTGNGTVIRSSSTQPGLMTRMLEALDVRDGHRVLEIGTGTGYNTALLCHRLGDDHVFSVDVEPDLVDLARTRLAGLGHHPTLDARDGALGLPEHAPFDRIIATCAVPAVPWPWIDQLQPGGILLTDLKTAICAGSLIRLTRTAPDRAEGRFDATYAAFMDLRHHPGATPTSGRIHRDHDHAHTRTTSLDPRTPWTNPVVWFLATFALGHDIALGYTGPSTDLPPTASWITTSDGSWAEITLATDDSGRYPVTEGGPHPVWTILERTQQHWLDLGQPGWHRFGLTATPTHQALWLDHPTSPHTWPFP